MSKRDYGSGSISQQKNGMWTARLYVGSGADGKRRVKAFYGKTKSEVRKKLTEFKNEKEDYSQNNAYKMYLSDYMMNWLTTVKKVVLKPTSYDRLRLTIESNVIPSIGHLQMGAVQSQDIQKMLTNMMDDGYSFSTIKKAFLAVKACFNYAAITGGISKSPIIGVALPSEKLFDSKELHYYSEEEAKRICKTALSVYPDGSPIYPMGNVVILALCTGMRIGEILALQWKKHIDFENRMITVCGSRVLASDKNSKKKKLVTQTTTKSDAGHRYLKMSDDTYDALRALQKITGANEYVVSTRNSKPTHPRSIDRTLRRILARAGFPEDKKYGFHALRHTYASIMLEKGENIKTISENLGHSDITTTYNIYIHITEKMKVKAAKSINLL